MHVYELYTLMHFISSGKYYVKYIDDSCVYSGTSLVEQLITCSLLEKYPRLIKKFRKNISAGTISDFVHQLDSINLPLNENI